MTDARYWVGFNLIPQIGPMKARRLLDHFGDLAAAWRASPIDLAAAGLDRRALDNVIAARPKIDLDAEMDKIARAGVRVLTLDDPAYPRLLSQISNPPFALYVKGEITAADEWSIAVVGTRRASAYGREVTRQIVADLVRNHITIVSGLARGIDAEAHRVALDAKGRTLAVLGSGVDVIYPPEHVKLAQGIAEHGALISEYPLGTQPEAVNFPPRNRIISGLSLGSLIVEGDENTGARITMEDALEQDRETFAVPGSIFRREARGPNKMLQRGEAKLVTCAADILEELNLTMVEQQQQVRAAVPENEMESVLLKHLSTDPVHIDELGRETGLPIATVSSTLALMELKGMVAQVGGMNYVVARESAADYAVDGGPKTKDE
ncbi:MAG: DNA-processing protein DprA [Chloroflexota bacterium]|nr:DNA-processing protein DprA [Chloroflexota bacterium]